MKILSSFCASNTIRHISNRFRSSLVPAQPAGKFVLLNRNAGLGGMFYDSLSPPSPWNHVSRSRLHGQARKYRYRYRFSPLPPSRFISNFTGDSEANRDPELVTIRSSATGEPTIFAVFEPDTSTWQYLVADPMTSIAVIIDPVLDYNPATQTISTHTADSLLSLVKKEGLEISIILETHAHADHLTAASYIQHTLSQSQEHKPPIGIGQRIWKLQKLFARRYEVPAEEYEGAFGKLFEDNEHFSIGNLSAKTMHLPGHTPDHLGYKIGGKNLFTKKKKKKRLRDVKLFTQQF